jgi:hypothetical protein
MLFKRKAKEEAALEERPPPGDGANLLRDALGLHHLWYLDSRLREELVRASRANTVFSIAAWRPRLLPGEELPNEHLKRVAELIAKSLRSYDLVSRVDEVRFVAILFDASYEAASTVAFRIKGELQVRVPTSGKWQAGVATFGRDGVDGETLIQTTLRRLEDEARG